MVSGHLRAWSLAGLYVDASVLPLSRRTVDLGIHAKTILPHFSVFMELDG